MNKKKLKLVISNYDDLTNPYYSGGGAGAIHEVAKRLRKDYAVTVVTGNYRGAKNETIEGVEYRRIGLSFVGARVGQFLFYLLLPLQVLRGKHDLWMESFTPPFSTAFLPLFTKKPVIALVHMLASDYMRERYKLPFHLVESQGLKVYKHFVVLSEQTRKKIRKANPKARITLIPNGVSIPKSVAKPEGKHILFLGRIEVHQKGLDLLLQAFRQALPQLQEKLVIAGSGFPHEEKKLKNLLAKYKLTNHVSLAGRVRNGRKTKLLSQASLVALPARYETHSMVALEGLAFNKPLVSFDIEGLRWLPRDCCVKVTPFSIEAMSRAFLSLAKDGRKRRKITAHGRKFVRNFAWESVADRYKKVFLEAQRQKGGRS